MKKRMAIYVIYDSEGVIDDYIWKFIGELIQKVDLLVIICNGVYSKKNLDNLRKFAQVFQRENYGYDVGAYKQAILEFIGIEEIKKYEQLLLINDTFFGMFIPIGDIIDDMSNKNLDFWGITKQTKADLGYGEIDENIQSYFLCFDKKVIQSPEFEIYWEDMPYPRSHIETCMVFENTLTSYFSKRGFVYDVYVHSEQYDTDSTNNFNHYWYLPYTLIKNNNMPLLKVKPFEAIDNDVTVQDEMRKALDYLEEKGLYKKNLILKHIIRKISIDKLIYSLKLIEYPEDSEKESNSEKRVFIVVFISSVKSFEFQLERLKKLIKKYRVIIISNDFVVSIMAKEYRFEYLYDSNFNRYSVIFKLKNLWFESEYLAYIHDGLFEENKEKTASWISYYDTIYDNLFLTDKYIDGVISLFDKNDMLGLCMARSAKNAKYFVCDNVTDLIIGDIDFLINIFKIKKLDEMHFKQIFLENAFWIRTEILSNILALHFWDLDDKKTIKMVYRILPQILQKKGWLSIYISTKLNSKTEIMNSNLIQTDFVRVINYDNELFDYENIRTRLHLWSVGKMIGSDGKIYIYGAGINGKKLFVLMQEAGMKIEAFVVSVQSDNVKTLFGLPVLELEEIKFGSNDYVVMGMNWNNITQVIPLLKEKICEENIIYP